MPHKGINQYIGDEGSNVALGQLGFKVLSKATNTGDGNFVAFKVLGGAATVDVYITCTCHIGDDLTIANVLTGEIVWGPFKKIECTAKSATTVAILCYYG